MAVYLVTGAAGFIGSNICEQLLHSGETVIGLDNLSNGFEKNIEAIRQNAKPNQFTFLKEDIRDLDACKKACEKVDYVIHQAALGSVPRSIEDPSLYNDNNTTGTLNMLLAAKAAQVKRFVSASSSSVYGDTPTLPKIESMNLTPKSPYAVSKITGEYYCQVFYQAYQLPTVSLRYFNIFGPRQNPESQYAAVIPKFITAFLTDTPPTIYGDGEQTRDFTYISNVVYANIQSCLSEKVEFGGVYNIGCGYRVSLNTLVNQIATIMKSKLKPQFLPPRLGDVKDSLADINRAVRQLNYNELTLLDEGLKKTVDWFVSHATVRL